jgi:flagellar motility protein MotE (MotC chaperone)
MKPSPLVIVAALFAASFAGRAVDFAYAAAQGPGEPKPPAAEVENHRPADEPRPSAAPEPALPAVRHEPQHEAAPVAVSNAERDSLLAAIRERARALDRREAEIARREKELEAIERRVAERTAELKAVKEELEQRLSFAATAAQEDITRLARMYEAMKPAKAGEIFNAMDPSFAAGFLTEMNSESAALILANMDTDKAYATSVIIAGRNAAVNRP